MTRDPDLIRKILVVTEANPSYSLAALSSFNDLLAAGYDLEAISYHVLLLEEAGYLIASNEGEGRLVPVYLTWTGHEFLDAARNDNNWAKVKKAMSISGGFVVSVAQQILQDLMAEQVKKLLT